MADLTMGTETIGERPNLIESVTQLMPSLCRAGLLFTHLGLDIDWDVVQAAVNDAELVAAVQTFFLAFTNRHSADVNQAIAQITNAKSSVLKELDSAIEAALPVTVDA